MPIYPKVGYMGVDSLNIQPETFDVIIGIQMIEHLRNSEEYRVFYTEAYRFLKKGGVLILETHNCSNPKVFKNLIEHWERMEHGPVLDQDGIPL